MHTPEEQHDHDVKETKRFRQRLDAILQDLKGETDCAFPNRTSAERDTAIMKIQEGIMWLGMDLKALNTPNPYPESYNPENTDIEPTADGLKL